MSERMICAEISYASPGSRVIRSSIWLANTTVSFGVAAHAAGMTEVNGNAAADAIKARLFNMPRLCNMPSLPVSWCLSENTLNRHSPDGQPIRSSERQRNRPLKQPATGQPV